MARTYPQLAHLPRTGGEYLYAFQFSDGRIKVGSSYRPRERAAEISRALRVHIVRAVSVPAGRFRTYGERLKFERVVQKRIASIAVAHPGELFTNLKFGEAAHLLRQVVERRTDTPATAPATVEG